MDTNSANNALMDKVVMLLWKYNNRMSYIYDYGQRAKNNAKFKQITINNFRRGDNFFIMQQMFGGVLIKLISMRLYDKLFFTAGNVFAYYTVL